MADYNINAITRRVVFTGSAGLGPYAFTFEVLDENDVAVYFNTTLLTLTTDYTVTINANGTGSVTIVTGSSVPSTPTASDSIIIVGARDIERVTDFVTAGDLLASSLNEQLDALTIFDQQLAEENARTLRAPVYDPALVADGGTLDMTLPAKAARAGKYLQFNSTTGNPEAGPDSTDVTALADIATDIATLADIEDGTDATDAIQTVAGISANVTTVAGIASNVSTVAGIQADVTAVAGDATDIGTVATNIASVNTVAGNISEVVAVANDLNEAVSEVETVANDLNEAVSEIETVAASIANVDTVGTNIANVNTVAGIDSNVTTVAGISANVTTVAGISGNVTTVAGISGDVTTVAADGTDIGTVAGAISNVNTVAGISGNVTTVAGISGNVTTVANNDANVTTVATNIADVNNFADKYRIAASAPTTSLDEGDLYFNTTDNQLYVYNGSAWQAASPDIVGDTTPQLGGNLDLNGNDITGTGNVDITGTLTADGLTVDGDAKITTSSGIGLQVHNNSSNQSFLQFTNSVTGETSASGLQIGIDGAEEGLVWHYRSEPIKFATGNTERLRIGSGGDVSLYADDGTTQGFFWDASTQRLGLGTTGPSTPLHISSTSYPQTRITNAISFSVGVDSSNNYVIDPTSGTTRNIVMQNSGAGDINVGIGTASPAQALDVDGNIIADNFQLRGSDTANNLACTYGYQSGANGARLVTWGNGTSRSGAITFDTGNSERMRLDSSGNLLVGQSTTALPGLANTTTGISVAGQYDLIAASRASGAAVLVNRNTDDGSLIEFSQNGSTKGSIGVYGNRLYAGTGDVGLWFNDQADYITSINTGTATLRDAAVDIGNDSYRFKDLYLSGGVYLGGTGSANYLDDYEEGTWTPTNAGATLSVTQAKYTKVGRMVTVACYVTADANTSGDWGGLPFAVDVAGTYSGSVGYQNDATTETWNVLADSGTQWTLRKGATQEQLASGKNLRMTLTYFTT
jgi:hypothetical protein